MENLGDSKLLADVIVEIAQRLTNEHNARNESENNLKDALSEVKALHSLRDDSDKLLAENSLTITRLKLSSANKLGIMQRTEHRENQVIREMKDWASLLEKSKPSKNTQRTKIIQALKAWSEYLGRGPLHETEIKS